MEKYFSNEKINHGCSGFVRIAVRGNPEMITSSWQFENAFGLVPIFRHDL
jgi:hypothetical protein